MAALTFTVISSFTLIISTLVSATPTVSWTKLSWLSSIITSAVVDEEDPEAELTEEHDDGLEVGGDDGVQPPVRPHYERNLRPRPRPDVVSREDVAGVELLAGPGETWHGTLRHGAHRAEGELGQALVN